METKTCCVRKNGWLITELKVFADDKINVAKMMIYVFDRRKHCGKRKKMLVASIFSFSHNVFNRPFTSGNVKSRDLWQGVNLWTF